MAIYHLSIKIFSRGKGASAVAKAAYRAAEKLTSDQDGQIHDYTRKRGVVHTEILLPSHAPPEYADRAVLWNAVEKSETPKNAQLAREIEIALPAELSREQNIALAHEFVQRQFVSAGMCADVCVHEAEKGKPHAHIMLTMRPINEDGTWGAKSRKEYILDERGERITLPSGDCKTRKICTVDWNEHSKAETWRSAWADALNAVLEQQNEPVRVDHRSYERQGIEQIPTVRLGVAASQMERRGVRTERGDQNRAIAVANQELAQLRARINKLKKWIYAQPLQDAPGMVDLMNGLNGGQQLNSRWKRIADVKTAAKVLMFLQQNGITNMEQLAGKVTQLHQARYDLANAIKAQERRISTLNAHLAQAEIYARGKAVYAKYKQLDPKKREAFGEKHADEIAEHEAARKYLKDHLNGYGKIPDKSWRAERDRLLTERYASVEEYYKIRDDVKSVEVLRRSAENLMRDITPKQTHSRDRNDVLL